MNKKQLLPLMPLLQSILALGVISVALNVFAQTAATPPQGSETFFPYTPAQIKQFNQQTISPPEGPFGPVNPNQRRPKKPPFDSQYFSQPAGEQEAEALETQSAEPYDPVPATIKF